MKKIIVSISLVFFFNSLYSQERKNESKTKKAALTRCIKMEDYKVVFKSSAIVLIENACLIRETRAYPKSKISYKFYRTINGKITNVCPVFDDKNIDAIFIIQKSK